MMPEYSTSRLCSSIPCGGLASWVSIGIPSKPITLAANEPSTLPQICSRSSLKPISAPPFVDPLQQPLKQFDLAPRRGELGEPFQRRRVPLLRQPPVDLPRPPDQSLPHVQLRQRGAHEPEPTLQAHTRTTRRRAGD